MPVQVTHANDNSGRLFVAEKEGRIRIVHDGSTLDSPFLDIASRVLCCVHRGLIDIAFPPSETPPGHFYISYTNLDGHTVISRFHVSHDPNRADSESEEVVLVIDQPAEHHNGGHLEFSPRDGFLYVSSGDGGQFSYPDNPALQHDTLLSKLLRIDVESGVSPYSIPDTNPFAQSTGHRKEIWALGLRNPWGFAFDKLTGDLYIPDPGHIKHEEVNFQPAESQGGENYGWNIKEGSRCFDSQTCSAQDLISPVVEYDHVYSCAIVGGAVYRGSDYPALQGIFFYGDFCSGRVWGLKRAEEASGERIHDGWQSTLPVNARVPVSSVGEDQEGNLYVTGYADGALYLITAR
jgi:glucose/arabinose dehydrogenase